MKKRKVKLKCKKCGHIFYDNLKDDEHIEIVFNTIMFVKNDKRGGWQEAECDKCEGDEIKILTKYKKLGWGIKSK